MDSSVSPKDEIWFLRVCHYISKAVYLGEKTWKKGDGCAKNFENNVARTPKFPSLVEKIYTYLLTHSMVQSPS